MVEKCVMCEIIIGSVDLFEMYDDVFFKIFNIFVSSNGIGLVVNMKLLILN